MRRASGAHSRRLPNAKFFTPIVNFNDARGRRFSENLLNFVRKYLLLKAAVLLNGGRVRK